MYLIIICCCFVFNIATIKFILPSRLIGPPKDWASTQWFIQGNEESIYGKLYKNNMEGLSSFYPVVDGIDYLVNGDTEVALFQFMNLHSFQEYQCKVKTLKNLLYSQWCGYTTVSLIHWHLRIHVIITFLVSVSDNNGMEGSNTDIY